MTEPTTVAQLDRLEAFIAEMLSKEGKTYSRQKGDIAKLGRKARDWMPKLIAEHRKMRADIVDTVGEDGLKELLSDDQF